MRSGAAGQEALARSLHCEHEVVADSGHFIQMDEPGAVIDAVKRVVSKIRS